MHNLAISIYNYRKKNESKEQGCKKYIQACRAAIPQYIFRMKNTFFVKTETGGIILQMNKR